MAIYSVCSLHIQAESLSHGFAPFLVSETLKPESIDLTIQYIPGPYILHDAEKAAELSYMTVWKEQLPGNHFNWIYIPSNGIGTICVDEEYSHFRVYYHDFVGYLNQKDIAEIFSRYIQILLECKLIKSGYAVLHSACVESDGYAYAFTGPSGIGKSTRAAKWVECFSAEWISGDRPVINAESRTVYGVPWDGKEAIFRNVRYPLAAILKVRRSSNVSINELTEQEKMKILCDETVIPMWDPSLAAQAVILVKQIARQIPIYEICCDITDESIYASRELMMNILKRKGSDHETQTGI